MVCKIPELTVDWQHLLTSPGNFYQHTRAKSIPDPLAHLLWQAITDVPKADTVRLELDLALSQPPTLDEFTTCVRILGKAFHTELPA